MSGAAAARSAGWVESKPGATRGIWGERPLGAPRGRRSCHHAAVLSGKVRWQQVAMFALVALVPAASVSVLGLSAVSTAEITAQREVSAMLSGAAERTRAAVERGLREAQESLPRREGNGGPADLAAAIAGSAPPFADPIVLADDLTLLAPEPTSTKPPVHDPACEADAGRLAEGGAARGEVRARILASCREARNPSNRFLWPLAALDALRDGQGDPGDLAAWLEQHAPELSPLERRATLLDVRSMAVLEPVRARITAALTGQRSRRDDLAAELATPEAAAALERARRSSEVVAWKSATSMGAVHRLSSGRFAGVVVHEASLAGTFTTPYFGLPDEVSAEVLAGPEVARLAAEGKGQTLRAQAVIAPRLAVLLRPKDPGIVARQARRSRFVLGGVGVGSTLLACLLALLLYRRMRDVERSSDLRTDFVSTVSHELRTPIASVRMLAELLEEGRVPAEEQAEVVAALSQEARRLGDTVDRLLGFSRMAAGRYRVERRRGKVAEPVLQAITAFEERHPDGPRVERAIDDTLEADIDAGQIRLAVDNLLANARKYAPEGGPYTVTVERAAGRGGEAVILRVGDRGPGIARRDQKRIFQPFERADDRLSRATEGSGIGLALVAHVARAHGGRAWVESEPGQGATFCFRIENGESE